MSGKGHFSGPFSVLVGKNCELGVPAPLAGDAIPRLSDRLLRSIEARLPEVSIGRSPVGTGMPVIDERDTLIVGVTKETSMGHRAEFACTTRACFTDKLVGDSSRPPTSPIKMHNTVINENAVLPTVAPLHANPIVGIGV